MLPSIKTKAVGGDATGERMEGSKRVRTQQNRGHGNSESGIVMLRVQQCVWLPGGISECM